MSREGIIFIPLPVESLGGWDSDSISFIRRIAHYQASRLGLDPHDTSQHLFQRLSISLWRWNGNMLASRVSISSPSVDGGL